MWEWTEGQGELDRPHFPTLLDSGNILIFDNGWFRGSSRVVEMDPRNGAIVWIYDPSGPDAFYTRRGGMAQPLPNGNLLLTQQAAGRIFEITRSGEIVWDFWNPQIHSEKGRRQSSYRAWRWSPEELAKIALPDRLLRSLAERGYLAKETEDDGLTLTGE